MRNQKSQTWLAIAMVAIIGPLLATNVVAQVLEEIVVTAQKREQNLQDIGISVTAFTGDQLRTLGLENTTDLEAQTPGLLVGEYGGAGATTTINIRGVSQLDFSDHQESPNAVYVDGAYVSFIGGVNVSMFDLERVEVLRGPQGTLFGRNATGGLVHLITRKPTEDFEAYLDLTVGEYSKVRSEGALSGPLSDSVQGRLSFSTDHHDGFYENATGPDLVENATINLRGQLNIDLSDQTSLLLSTRYSDTDRPNAGVYHQFGAAPDPTNDFLVERITDSNRALLDSFCTGFNGFPTMTPPGGSDCFGNIESSDVFSVSPDTIGFFERQLLGATGTLTWQVNDSVAFTSITDFQSIEKSYLEDNDSTSLPITTFFQEQDADQFSQEIRLSGGSDNTQWVVGAYYLTIDNDSQQRVNQLPFFDIEFFDLLDHQTDTYAVFGQTDFQLSDRVSLIAGLRWTEDEKDMDLLNDCFDTDAFGFGGTCNAFGIAVDTRIVGGRSDSDWSGKLELNYKPNDNWLWYIGATRGIKGGVLNAAVGAAAGVNLASLQIEPEALTSIEGGFKSTLANGRARLNVSVFSYDYSDYQAYDFVGVAAVLRNQDANSFGGEIELQATPVDGLDIVLGAAYLDSEVEDVLLPSGQRSNQEMPFAPELTFNGLVRYEWPAIGGAIAVQSDFSYVDDRFYSSVNHPVLSDDSYFLANARISYIGGDRRWDVTAFVNNLTDEEYTVYAFDLSFQGGGYAIESYAPPRWAGVSFSYRWD